jgi:hypothetical protein
VQRGDAVVRRPGSVRVSRMLDVRLQSVLADSGKRDQ